MKENESITTEGSVQPTREPLDTAIRQQRMKSWQPILDPTWVIAALLVLGIVFVPTGIKLAKMSADIVEMSVEYDSSNSTHPCAINNTANANRSCSILVTVPANMTPPILIYYEITNFHQNHRAYMTSRDDNQLQTGTLNQSKKVAEDCEPLNMLGGIRIWPCGLVANTLFNDVISLTSGNDADGVPLQMIEEGIAWKSDLEYRFSQPDGFYYEQCDSCNNCSCSGTNWSCVEPYQDESGTCFRYFYPEDNKTQYLYETYPMVVSPIEGVLNEHFVVWMRMAALPHFRKLYAFIEQPVTKGENLTFNILANWEVTSFKGSKKLIITTSNTFGGKNPRLGLAYMAIGGVCLLLALLFGLKHCFKPRRLGDKKYLVYKED